MTRAPELSDIRTAAAAIGGRVHWTPLLRSTTLARSVGAPVLLKAELFQRTGSFKIRGALNRLDAMSADDRARGVITVSAGNHAQGVALACAESAVDALVLMPATASEAKVAATRAYGATVDLESSNAAEALDRMVAISEETGRVILHPFDDPLVIAGQGTVGLEACTDAPDADVFVVPVGGGGLISGIAVAVKALRPQARVIAVQPERTATLGPSLAARRPVPGPRQPTIADALTAPTIGELCLDICSRHVDDVVTLTEDEIADGLRFAHQRTKLACEAAGAAPIAALLANKVDVGASRGVVVVVSGGNISGSLVAKVMAGEPEAAPA
jgi:threonine dehydratase